MKPVNLNRYRKDRARAEKRTKGDENAAKFGRSKAAREADRTRAELEAHRHSQHERDRE